MTFEKISARGEPDHIGWKAEPLFFRTLLFIVALAPLPLASNRPLPAALLSLSVGLLVIGWSLRVALGGTVAVSPRRIAWPLSLFGLVCLWIVVQWLPVMPPSWADPTWQTASEALGRPLPGRISVNPHETLGGLMRLLAYAGVFWLALQLCRAPERARRAIRAVAAIGGLYAAYGIIVYLAGNNWVLLYPKWAYFDALTSTFVNRNSFATFAGLCLLCALSALLDNVFHALTLDRPLRRKLAVLLETIASQSIWLTFAILSLATALVLTGSRAGFASFCGGLLILIICYRQRRIPGRTFAAAIAAIVACLLGVALWTSGGPLSARYVRDDAVAGDLRFEIYEGIGHAIASSPWTGTGLGTFADVFPAYRSPASAVASAWDKAHNTYLENAVELGVPAALLLNASLLLLGLQAARGARSRRRDWSIPATGLAATVLVGLHSLVDFSLQIPAVATLYAFILGVAVSQSRAMRDDQG